MPTYRLDRHLGYNMRASPENISVAERVQDADKIVVVPSREMQADYELQAAEFLEGTMRRAMKNHQRQGTTIPGSDGHAQGETYKSATSDESAREPMISMQLIEALEEALNITAQKEYLPMQLGDVPKTAADTSYLEDWIDFKPNTDIRDGIQKFIEWYRDFYKI